MKKRFDFREKPAYCIIMTNLIEPLSHFQVVAVCRKTGKPQFASVTAPSQTDADDFVADVQADWIVIRDNADLRFQQINFAPCDHCDHDFPVDELVPCAVEPDFRFCGDCADDLRD
jgi:hypothetical protein